MDKLKVVLVGDDGIGKTSLVMTYMNGDNKFPSDYVPTVFENWSKKFDQGCSELVVEYWDTRGNEDYDELRPLSYTRANLFLICFSLDNEQSLENVQTKYIPEINQYDSHAYKILVGLKLDRRDEYEKKKQQEMIEKVEKDNDKKFFLFRKKVGKYSISKLGKEMAKKMKCDGYEECSSLEFKGVKEVFQRVLILLTTKRVAK